MTTGLERVRASAATLGLLLGIVGLLAFGAWLGGATSRCPLPAPPLGGSTAVAALVCTHERRDPDESGNWCYAPSVWNIYEHRADCERERAEHRAGIHDECRCDSVPLTMAVSRLTSDERGVREAITVLGPYDGLSTSRESCEVDRAMAAADIVEDCIKDGRLEWMLGHEPPVCLGWTDSPVPALSPRTVSQHEVMELLKCESVPVS
jgi:hypothetical protein